jgi:hypothetical protein
MLAGMAEAGSGQLRQPIVVDRGQGAQDAGEIAGCALAGRWRTLDQVIVQPRAASRSAALLPARPAPMTIAWLAHAPAPTLARLAAAIAAVAATLAYSGRICGKRITSRMFAESVSSITRRSMPMPQPAVGGRPYSSART